MFVDVSFEFLLFNGRLCAVCELRNAQLQLAVVMFTANSHCIIQGKEGRRKEKSEVREGVRMVWGREGSMEGGRKGGMEKGWDGGRVGGRKGGMAIKVGNE